MIKEAYCSFEIAKLLQEKGFNELCFRLIREDGEYIERPSQAWNGMTKKQRAEWYIQPTHQMAMAWLREKDIDLCIHPDFPCSMDYTIEFYENGEPGGCCGYYKTYEEAVEASLKYVLENLI